MDCKSADNNIYNAGWIGKHSGLIHKSDKEMAEIKGGFLWLMLCLR